MINYILVSVGVLFLFWVISSPMLTHKEMERRPNAKKVPKNTLAVRHEEIPCGFSGSDTFFTYYITNGTKWRKIANFTGRALSMFYLITFQWSKRLKY